MDLEINFGRRRDDGKLIVNFAERREILWANTRYIKGFYLDELPDDVDGTLTYAMILINDRWNGKLYFLQKRNDWTKNDYFNFADKRFKQLGITHLSVV